MPSTPTTTTDQYDADDVIEHPFSTLQLNHANLSVCAFHRTDDPSAGHHDVVRIHNVTLEDVEVTDLCVALNVTRPYPNMPDVRATFRFFTDDPRALAQDIVDQLSATLAD